MDFQKDVKWNCHCCGNVWKATLSEDLCPHCEDIEIFWLPIKHEKSNLKKLKDIKKQIKRLKSKQKTLEKELLL